MDGHAVISECSNSAIDSSYIFLSAFLLSVKIFSTFSQPRSRDENALSPSRLIFLCVVVSLWLLLNNISRSLSYHHFFYNIFSQRFIYLLNDLFFLIDQFIFQRGNRSGNKKGSADDL